MRTPLLLRCDDHIEQPLLDKGPIAEKNSTMTPQKRTDLQIWRSLAIIGVLLFHIWPQIFQNGYLGVDIFFVLSGFLMAAIMNKHEEVTWGVCLTFYTRRVSRIVPVYLFVILATLLVLFTSINKYSFELLREDARWAVTFMSNRQDFYKKADYFDFEGDPKYLKHCWSLAAEMQFYLIVPALFLLYKNLFKNKIGILVEVFLASLLYQVNVESPIVKYESMLSRIWQFLAGIIAQTHFNSYNHSSCSHKFFVYFLLMLTLVITFVPMIEIDRQFGSIVVVMITAFLINCSDRGKQSPFLFLSKISPKFVDSLVYLGDISYILYLVHWPVVTYYRYLFPRTELVLLGCKDHSNLSGVLFIFYSICYVYLNNMKIQPLQMTLLTLKELHPNAPNIRLVIDGVPLELPARSCTNTSELTLKVIHNILNFSQPIVLPNEWSSENEIEFAQKAFGDYCFNWDYNCKDTFHRYSTMHQNALEICETKNFKDGLYTVAVIGNSHAICGAGALHMNPLFKKVVIAGVSGCWFPAEPADREECIKGNLAIFDVIKNLKPDFVFVVSSCNGPAMFKQVTEPIESDSGVLMYQEMINTIQPHTKHIFINGPNVRFPIPVGPEYIRTKENQQPFEMVVKPNQAIYNKFNFKNARRRMSVLKCPKCTFYRYSDAFCDSNYCNSIDSDTLLPLFRDTHHINILGDVEGPKHTKKIVEPVANPFIVGTCCFRPQSECKLGFIHKRICNRAMIIGHRDADGREYQLDRIMRIPCMHSEGQKIEKMHFLLKKTSAPEIKISVFVDFAFHF